MAASNPVVTLVRELILAGGMIGLIVLAMWAHTGSMPPLVVVESSSMVHDAKGEVGSIDAGDLVLVHDPEGKKIVTFAEATDPNHADFGYESHGLAGDVIIYERNGESESTPIIHRAILRVKINRTMDADNLGNCDEGTYDSLSKLCIISWDIPGTKVLDQEKINLNFDGVNASGKYDCQIDSAGHGDVTLRFSDWRPRHPGFITLGDNNKCSDDQGAAVTSSGIHSSSSGLIGPVRAEWVIGISGAEVPWLGIVKLIVSGGNSPGISQVPGPSFIYLIILVGSILIAPILIDPIARKLIHSSPEVIESERESALDYVLKSPEEE
ncbi:MAG TPA: S26 family signal peptidase [Candidatus Poseidoniales archaeon]|jgi:signal peptidase|nr:MAG: hypothetical protein CXT71_00070 [Euryarchaeota archaeon]HIF45406.1 S26 family signal peptidase [Candidatus Poseidoniales archaeon]HIL64710.1 S26 family signal peptidase [Candidatus Poseidoniales archaeon]